MKTSIKLFICLALFCLNSYSQKKHDAIISYRSSIMDFNNSGLKVGTGIDMEYFLTKNFSVRGGFSAGPNFVKLTPAPIFWAMIAEGGHTHHSHRYGRTPSLKTYLTLLALSDGFSYYIPLSKKLYLTPYIAPLQLVLTKPKGAPDFVGNVFSSVGLGLKYIDKDNFTADVSVEYNRVPSILDTRRGVSINFSVGYRFGKKFD